MAKVKDLENELLEVENTTPAAEKSGIDTKDGSNGGSDAPTTVVSLEALVSEAESCKSRGNVEFYKGKALVKHTAGKNLLRDACILYAEGLQALAQADARLLAQGGPDGQHAHQPPSQPQPQPEEDQEVQAGGANSNVTGIDNNAEATPTTPASTTSKDRATAVEDPATTTATAAFGGLPPPSQLTAELLRRADAVRPSLYLNLAACNLLLQEWAPAIACCSRVLEDFCAAEVETAADDAEEVVVGGGGGGGGGERGSAGGSRSTTPTATEAGETSLSARGELHQERQAQKGPDGEARRNSGGGRLAGDGANGAADSRPEAEGEREVERLRRREIAAKCLYRRAAARKGGGDLSAAREDLVGALRLRPRDAAISRELKGVEKKLADEEAKESLRRKTEEGRRRRQQQQQQQQQQQSNCSPGNRAADANATATATATTAATPPGAPREDNAATIKTPSTAAAAGSLDEETVHAGQAGGGRLSQGQQGAPRSDVDDDGPEESGAGGESSDRSEAQSGDNEVFPTWNGGECRNGLYAWNQSIREVQVCVKVPDWAGARDIRVDIRRLRVSVAVAAGRTRNNDGNGGSSANLDRRAVEQVAPGRGNGGGDGAASGGGRDEPAAPTTTALPLLEGGLSRPVQVDECLWTMERAGRVLLYLQKELPADCEPGFEWWASVLEGDSEVDVLTCDAGSDASKYPEHAKRRGARALWEHQNKSPEEKLKEEQMRNARRQMEEEAEERQRDLDNAMKDPKKAELYRQLRETMPDTSICIK